MFFSCLVFFLADLSKSESSKQGACSLTLSNGDSTYTITKTEINVNKPTLTAHKTGDCCYDIYSDPLKKRGNSQTIHLNGTTDVSIGFVGSVYLVACYSYGATVTTYIRIFLITAVVIVLLLVVVAFLNLGLINRFRKQDGRHKINNATNQSERFI